ncbi:hypothetical protein M514_28012, partial [Trichuris suis]
DRLAEVHRWLAQRRSLWKNAPKDNAATKALIKSRI